MGQLEVLEAIVSSKGQLYRVGPQMSMWRFPERLWLRAGLEISRVETTQGFPDRAATGLRVGTDTGSWTLWGEKQGQGTGVPALQEWTDLINTKYLPLVPS